jgi:hypothetical protein
MLICHPLLARADEGRYSQAQTLLKTEK